MSIGEGAKYEKLRLLLEKFPGIVHSFTRRETLAETFTFRFTFGRLLVVLRWNKYIGRLRDDPSETIVFWEHYRLWGV